MSLSLSLLTRTHTRSLMECYCAIFYSAGFLLGLRFGTLTFQKRPKRLVDEESEVLMTYESSILHVQS
jgi:hypothetical protein